MRVIVLLVVALGCGGTPNIETLARTSYDADLDVVFDNVVAVTAAKYDLRANRGDLVVKTVWKEIEEGATMADVPSGQAPGTATSPRTRRNVADRYFLRFDIRVTGERPYRVEIVRHVSAWSPGMPAPRPLHGDEIPAYAQLRTDALARALHERLERYAVTQPTHATR